MKQPDSSGWADGVCAVSPGTQGEPEVGNATEGDCSDPGTLMSVKAELSLPVYKQTAEKTG